MKHHVAVGIASDIIKSIGEKRSSIFEVMYYSDCKWRSTMLIERSQCNIYHPILRDRILQLSNTKSPVGFKIGWYWYQHPTNSKVSEVSEVIWVDEAHPDYYQYIAGENL